MDLVIECKGYRLSEEISIIASDLGLHGFRKYMLIQPLFFPLCDFRPELLMALLSMSPDNQQRNDQIRNEDFQSK